MRKTLLHAKAEVIQRRLIEPSRKVDAEVAAMNAGLEGEKRLYYFLSEIPEPKQIIHDLRLRNINGSTHFQIDALLILPDCVYIVEAKHLHGNILLNRLTRKMERGESNFEDPIAQILRQKQGLEHYLPAVSIHTLVAFTHKNATVDICPPDSQDRSMIAYARELPGMIKNQHPQATLNIQHTAKLLLKHHEPYNPSPFSYFEIDSSHIHVGIQCEKCRKWHVKRQARLWICQKCGVKLKNPHIQALKDYVKLFGRKATNQQIRQFTQIDSSDAVKYLLKKWSVSCNGEKKGRYYLFPKEWEYE